MAASDRQLPALAALDDVAWIENFALRKKHNDHGGGLIMGSLAANNAGYDGSTQTVAIADTDPHYFAGTVLAMVKRHFPEAQQMHDFREAVASGRKGVVLVDIQPKPMQPWVDHATRIDVDAYFFDAAMNPVSRFSGHGEHHVALGEASPGVQASIDAAVAQLDQKMTALVH